MRGNDRSMNSSTRSGRGSGDAASLVPAREIKLVEGRPLLSESSVEAWGKTTSSPRQSYMASHVNAYGERASGDVHVKCPVGDQRGQTSEKAKVLGATQKRRVGVCWS